MKVKTNITYHILYYNDDGSNVKDPNGDALIDYFNTSIDGLATEQMINDFVSECYNKRNTNHKTAEDIFQYDGSEPLTVNVEICGYTSEVNYAYCNLNEMKNEIVADLHKHLDLIHKMEVTKLTREHESIKQSISNQQLFLDDGEYTCKRCNGSGLYESGGSKFTCDKCVPLRGRAMVNLGPGKVDWVANVIS